MSEQELLAVVHAMRTWRIYLEGAAQRVRIINDHRPNIFLPTQRNLGTVSRCKLRWLEFLQSLTNFTEIDWVYKPGATNVADPLSRCPVLVAAVKPVAAIVARGEALAGGTVFAVPLT